MGPFLGSLGVEWDRPWALWFVPLFAIAWWLLVIARRPRPTFTGSFALWQGSAKQESRNRRRGILPTRYWELTALLCGLLALGGPQPGQSQDVRALQVVLDRTPSMYLQHGEEGGGTRLARALEALEEWQPKRAMEFVDPGSTPVEPSMGWNEDWRTAPKVKRPGVSWPEWDRPGVLWLTDKMPDVEPSHASVLSIGGSFQPGPVALTAGGVLVDRGGSGPIFEERLAPRVVGGLHWPEAWQRFAQIWAEDRGFRWAPNGEAGSGHALRLTAPEEESLEILPFDLVASGYRLTGTCEVSPDSNSLLPGPWSFPTEPGEQTLISWAPGTVHLNVAEWGEVEGDLAAFAMDLARFLDSAQVLPPDIVSREERAASAPGELRQGAWSPAGPALEKAPCKWPAWLAIAAMLCLLASLGSGWNRIWSSR